VTLHLVTLLGAATLVDRITFGIGATIVILGAVGVVISRNPVHAALMLVMTLFGVAVLFVQEGANFLAAVQVIVYAGAIVVLFLFVIMFLGVDRQENLDEEPLAFQRPLAGILVVLGLAGIITLGVGAKWSTGAPSVAGPAQGQPGGDVAALGRSIFTTYLFAFEITAALLVIAVVGAVVLARRPRSSTPADETGGGEGDAAAPTALTPGPADGEIDSTESVAVAVAEKVVAAHGRADVDDGDSGGDGDGGSGESGEEGP
jgi:NADH-quinone oxidoreductase subunit J